MFNISTLIISIIVFASLILGLIAILRNPHDKTSRMFLYMTISIALWQVSNFLENEVVGIKEAGFLLRLDFASAVLVGFFWFLFVLNFSQGKISLNRYLEIFLSSLASFLVAFSFTDIIVKNIHVTNGVILFDHGYLWPLYAAVVLGFFLAGYIIVILNIIRSRDSLKIQNIYIFSGMLISSVIALVINLFLSNILDVEQSRVGIYATIIFVFCAFYSIVRYHLFNIKVIATESFVFILWMVLFFRIFLSHSINELAINFVIFTLAVLIGTLLVKSVEEEITLREELENSITGQKNLIHIMNHQIKGYLGKNKDIFAELLTDDYGKVPESALPLLRTGLEQTNEGVDFVSQILRGASAENGALIYDMKKTNLKDLLVKTFEEKKPAAEKKGLKINLQVDSGNYNMFGDEKQLREAITNLIDNAISYTLSGNIWVKLSEKYGRLVIIIKDTGVGVKEEDKNKLFKAGGITKDSIKVNIKSSGYGLIFVKSVILAHKGMVWFESDGEGRGTTFYVALPKDNK